MRMTQAALCLVIACLFACGGGGGGGGDDAPSLSLGFTRVPAAGLDAVAVRVTASGGRGTPSLSVDRGSISDPVADGDGWLATVTPTTTGEYTVTATLDGGSASRTALVLEDVHADWGQPEMVAGPVSTAGYEDGVTITPDGRYLFVQYGPYYWGSLLVFDADRADGGCGGDRLSPTRCEHPWINETIGPLGAPKRPGFPTGRFDGTTQLHNAASWGVGIDGAPNLAWTTTFFGFERQADGSFGSPFVVAFDDLGDGITNPFGLSFQPLGGDDYRAVFSLKDSTTTDLGFDLYTCDLTAGEATNLGTYVATTPGNPPARDTPFASALVDLGDNGGTQGNNHLELDAGGDVIAVWTDDEYDGDVDTHKLSVHVIQSGTFPTTSDYSSLVLPDVINVPGTEAIQPCMLDDGLYFTQDTSIAFAAYAGARDATGYATAGNWTAPTVILQKDTGTGPLDAADIGKIVALGEPTVAEIDGERVLYFVYVVVRGFDPITGIVDFDFQAGFAPALAPAMKASG